MQRCFNVPIDRQVEILESLRHISQDGGGFWDRHPSWEDRIANIKKSP